MSRSMDKSKILSLNRRNSVIQDDDILRTMRTNSSKMPIPHSLPSEETKKLIQRLEKLAKDEKLKRQEIQIKYDQFKQRAVTRQRQFYQILSKFDPNIPGDSKEDDYENYITEIYNKILITFEAFNEKARSLLDDRYSELYRLMERRIDILMQKMDNELAKYRKVSLTQRKQLQEAIRQIGVIAAETESENAEFRKKNQYMELRLKILKDEKRLLLQEITNLKAFIKEGVKNGIYKQKKKEQVINGDLWNNIQSIQMHKGNPPKTTHRRSLTSRQNRYQQPSFKNTPNSKPFDGHQTIDTYKIQRQSISQENIISHLRQQLQRQKNRNSQLVRFTLQLQAKQLKLIELVGSQIGTIITKTSQNSESSLVQNMVEDNEEDSEFSVYDRKEKVKIEGAKLNVRRLNCRTKHKQLRPTLEINSQNMASDNAQQQLVEQQKKFSNFVTSINKILQLPQNSTINPKLNNQPNPSNIIDPILQIPLNPQSQSQNPHSLINFNNTITKQPIITDPSHSKLTHHNQRIAFKSANKQYQIQNLNTKNTILFANYSPLDIIDITRSIEIN